MDKSKGRVGANSVCQKFYKMLRTLQTLIWSVFLGDIIWIKEIYDGMEAVKKGDSMFLGRFWVYPPTIFDFIMKCQTFLCLEEILLESFH